MTDFAQDRELERRRYNDRAARQLRDAGGLPANDGAAAMDPVLRQPYLSYEALIRHYAAPNAAVLDLCAGDGLFSLVAARVGARVTASDIAENNLVLARERAARQGLALATLVADAERLPLPDHSVDLVTCAGGLSYVDLDRLLAELARVLRPGGALVAVDSFNHNPIYRLNRYWHYLRGRRSASTLRRMPSRRTLAAFRRIFPDLQVQYFGTITFLMPVVRRVVGADRAARLSAWFDRHFAFAREGAFKIVIHGRRPGGTAA